MNFFSHDIEAARRALYRDFERGEIPKAAWGEIERHFLKGFEIGWNNSQNPVGSNAYPLLMQYLEKGVAASLLMQNPSLNSRNFGFALGMIVGALRARPREVLGNPGIHRPFMKKLEQKPEYYEFVRRVIDESANL